MQRPPTTHGSIWAPLRHCSSSAASRSQAGASAAARADRFALRGGQCRSHRHGDAAFLRFVDCISAAARVSTGAWNAAWKAAHGRSMDHLDLNRPHRTIDRAAEAHAPPGWHGDLGRVVTARRPRRRGSNGSLLKSRQRESATKWTPRWNGRPGACRPEPRWRSPRARDRPR